MPKAPTKPKRMWKPGGTGSFRQQGLDEMKLIVDLFAGGGGTGTGIAWATGREADIAVNHDPDAIAMHALNHPHTKHYCESVWDVDPVEVTQGRPVGVLWASPDCTHFSNAKGGQPVSKQIRGLAWVIVKWAALVRPEVLMMENVPEFKTWGPVDDNGQPIKARARETFDAFVACLTTGLAADHPAWEEIREVLGEDFPFEQLERGLGYNMEFRALRACDFGAPTIRKRLFGIARCDGRPIVWPEPTHGDPESLAVKSGRLKPWLTAADIIDWSIPCPSIFERKKPLAPKTMRRIANGLVRFVIDNPNPFIVPESAGCGAAFISRQFTKSGAGNGVNEPIATVLAKDKTQLVTAFLTQYHSETSPTAVRGQALDKPLLTQDTSNRYGLVAATLVESGEGPESVCSSHLVKLRGTCADGQPVTEPMPTITAGGFHVGEVRAFLVKYYGAPDNGQNLSEPLHTITTKDRFGLVMVHGRPYEIVDIGMRMLQPRELFDGNGFPADYIIDRDAEGKPYPKTKQVDRCGNAVPPQFSEALFRANVPEMCIERAA